VGSLGVLGPTRMLYENAVAAVEAAANYLTDAVAGQSQLSPEN
ncbi:MAG: heat-inducible transcriptional repressor HrcA, partial [Cyanobacteria bacterium J06607_10]